MTMNVRKFCCIKSTFVTPEMTLVTLYNTVVIHKIELLQSYISICNGEFCPHNLLQHIESYTVITRIIIYYATGPKMMLVFYNIDSLN